MFKITGLLCALALATGCTGTEGPSESTPAKAEAPTPVKAEAKTNASAKADPELDTRDQYTLVKQIMTAKSGATREQSRALPKLRNEWVGRRYRWEVAYMPMLCPAAGTCVALPFDHNRQADLRIQQGWLPRLRLDDAGRNALADLCEGYARCVFTFEGTLKHLSLSTEEPTSLTFDAIELLSARDAMPSESWVLRRRPAAHTQAGTKKLASRRSTPR